MANRHQTHNDAEFKPSINEAIQRDLISAQEYIHDLEGLVCFLAGCYQKTKEVYYDNHMKKRSISNPNRRDLTEAEQSEWKKFPLIQGSRLRSIVSDIANAKKPNPKNIEELVRRFKLNPK